MITHHTQLLQALIDKYNLKSYLELGVQNPANNFNHIRCDLKTGVDPNCNTSFQMTSDDFFELVKGQGKELTMQNRRGYSMPDKWDLIFIDGLHTAEQVKRDFENSLKCLRDKGFILIHDCLPTDEITTCVPRGNQKVWHGDVYKFIFHLWTYEGIKFKTFNIDNGCCLVWKEATGPRDKMHYNGKKWGDAVFDWNFYTTNKHLMNVVDEVDI